MADSIEKSLASFDDFAAKLKLDAQDLVFEELALDVIRQQINQIVTQAITLGKTGNKLDDFIQQMLIKNGLNPKTSVYVMYKMRCRIAEKDLPNILSKEDAISNFESGKNTPWLALWLIIILMLWAWNPLRLRFWIALFTGLGGGFVGLIGTFMLVGYDFKKHPEVAESLISVISEDFWHALSSKESLDADAKVWHTKLAVPKITVRSSS